MRNQKQNTRLQQARGQLFICGMFGNCASSVLSPRTPPGMPEFAQKAAFVWTANEEEDLGRKSASPSSSSDARSSIASEVSTTSSVEELLAEIKAGNATKGAVSGLVGKLGKDGAATRELVRSSGVTEALIALLVLERQEEALHALAVLAEDEVTARAMATPEFLAVVVAFVSTGRKEARESACILLEKLSLEESFKATMGSSPGVMEALNDLLCDEDHLKLVKVATRTLLALCLLRDNRRRAVEVGAVASLLEMLPRARSATAEKALATLELLGTIEEGKAAIIDHALAVPVLVELILRVSDRGTEYAAGTLSCMCSDSVAMREAAVAHGAPTKLLLLIQSDCTARAKRKASQLLKVLHKLWVQDPCNPDSEGTKAIHY